MKGDDLYRRLGVPRFADTTTLRNAYRRLALRFHPDRAGVGATATFQLIAAAYDVLSNVERKAAYDRTLEPPTPSAQGPQRLFVRLSGAIHDLVTRAAAQVHSDGTIDLRLSQDERKAGGLAAVTIRLPVTCWVCGGLAKRHGFDCELCGTDGSVLEAITVWVSIGAMAVHGHVVLVPFDRFAQHRCLRFRIV